MQDVDALRDALLAQIEAADLAGLERLRVGELGKKGRITALMRDLAGLDAQARDIVAARVAAAVERGTQVVLATHHPEDVPTYVTRCLTLPARPAGRKRR